MELTEKNLEQLQEVIDSLNLDDLVQLNNAICDVCNYGDDRIYSTAEMDDVLCSTKPFDIALMVANGDFNPSYTYWRFNAYGHIYSAHSNDIDIDIDNVLSVYDRDPDLLPEDIQDFFNELEEESDTEADED